MLKKILIANRSEIACRVIRACKEMNISTVAIYSEADIKAKHVLLADEAVCVGPAPANQSYLNMDAVIKAAIDTQCDAIHPGYGFLAEKHEFSRKVKDAGLNFIGPNPEPMKLLGSKIDSRTTMIKAGIPVIPGMKSSTNNFNEFVDSANNLGYPVLIKASDGGGGKGMRIVRNSDDLLSSIETAIRESKSAFGSDVVYIEKYIESPRHIEFQVAADKHGNVIHLFERECSIQRRHQKIIEETPSTALDSDLRRRMGETAVNVIKASKYDNLGTVEFLLDKDKNFYFLEVNARIQVEHPITEMVTGIDLVKLQIRIANGETLPVNQDDLFQFGHAIECRIYAEDADNNFLPSAGKVLLLREPFGYGIRYDSGIYEGCDVPVYYDPILAKLIAWGSDREEARRRVILALKDNVILGVKTSIPYIIKVLEHQEFISGNTFTNFIETNMVNLNFENELKLNAALIVSDQFDSNRKSSFINIENNELPSPWKSLGKWEIANS
jgi:acetyl-CoA carboxylase, biotin carboxylase subunit